MQRVTLFENFSKLRKIKKTFEENLQKLQSPPPRTERKVIKNPVAADQFLGLRLYHRV
jgi:hypothetical protein